MQSGPPSAGDNLLGMEIDFDAYLGGLEALDESSISVRRTEHPEALIAAKCVAASGFSVAEAAEAVRAAWLNSLRYNFHEAHHLAVSEDGAVLRLITQIGPSEFYVTGQVTISATSG